MSETSADLATFFENDNLTAEIVERAADHAHESAKNWEDFDSVTRQQLEADGKPLPLGLALYILGRYREAREKLAAAPVTALSAAYLGHTNLALGAYHDAVEAYDQAAKHGWDALQADVQKVVALVRANDLDAAQKLVAKHAGKAADRPEWHFAQGLVIEAAGERSEPLQHYERALTLEEDYEPAMFRAAWLYDLQGDDEQAIDLYERLAERPRAKVNALMNLAVVLEDLGRFRDAMRCLRRVLRVHPNHTRARLFLKDVESSRQMVIEEGHDDRVDARTRMLDAPIGEFELSVRARNCLKKMNIHTLSQLIQLSEQELLAYKNFGDASLNEIKQLLARKGLRLGQRPDEVDGAQPEEEAGAPARPELPPEKEAVLNRPIGELELSVRSRRCLQRLNVNTLGDLMQHSEADLMSARNFGVTSLNEIKSRLADHGLALPPKRNE
jgi:DNA-directed RNA polymerase subunit alpha